MVSVNYVYGKDKTPMYKTDIISVKYTDNPQEVANSKNAVVEQSIVLSETGKIFSQLEDLYNSGTYVKALDMINSQTAPLIDFYKEKELLTDIDARPATEVILSEFENKFPCK